MSTKYVLGWTEDAHTFYWYESGEKQQFALTSPIGVKEPSFVSMCPDENGKMMVLGTGYPPYKFIHPVQVLKWSDFHESKNMLLWSHLASQKEPDGEIAITLRDGVRRIFGVEDSILVSDSNDDYCVWGFRFDGKSRFSCSTKNLKVILSQSVAQKDNEESKFACFPMQYEKFVCELVLPFYSAESRSVKDYISSLDAEPIDGVLGRIARIKSDYAEFKNNFEIEVDDIRPYLLARSFYEFKSSKRQFKRSIPIASFLSFVKRKYAKILFDNDPLNKPRLQSVSIFTIKGDSCQIKLDVEEYGQENEWRNGIDPSVFKILWNSFRSDYGDVLNEAKEFLLQRERKGKETLLGTLKRDVPLFDEKREKENSKVLTIDEQGYCHLLPWENFEETPRGGESATIGADLMEITPSDQQPPESSIVQTAEEVNVARSTSNGAIINNSATVVGNVCEKDSAVDGNSEEGAIVALGRALKNAGWSYSLRDIVRFHTSVKTGTLTILSGASGVGKSSLFKHYARFITGVKEEGTIWKRINVVSTWMEPGDLLGWNNPVSGIFQEAPGGLHKYLSGLEEHKDKLSLLCFEEMNLAQAELYFSDFLQAVSDSPEELKMPNPKGGDFKIPRLRIVGTCNIDHTTKPFTERFLDRCNYIDLMPRDDVSQGAERFFPDKLPETPKITVYADLEEKSATSPESIREVLKGNSNWEMLVDALKSLEVFPSVRVRAAMVEYIQNRPAIGGSDKDLLEKPKSIMLGIDEAITQRVLPKLLLRNEWDRDGSFTKTMNEKLLPACQAMSMELAEQFCNRILMSSSKARG